MSATTIENDLVHYEVLGRGRPVILVHGWLSSWRYWIPTMQQLSMKYRTYALDLWGYGDSGKDPARCSLDAHVRLLDAFLEKLGIGKVALVGHSLGGAVVIRYALQHPDKVARLMTISAPLFAPTGQGSSTGTAAAAPEASPAPPSPSAPSAPSAPSSPTPSPAPPATLPEQKTPPSPGPAPSPAPPDATPAQPTAAETPPPAAGQASETLLRRPKPQTTPTVLHRPPGLDALLGSEAVPPDLSIKPDEPSIPSPGPGSEAVPDPSTVNNPLRDVLLQAGPQELLERHLGKEVADYDRLVAEAAKTVSEAFVVSAASFNTVNLAQDVHSLKTPTLLIHGEQDDFLPPPDQKLIDYLSSDRDDFRCVIWPAAKHFPMLDEPTTFHRLVMDFLETRDLDDLEFKERWVRKVR